MSTMTTLLAAAQTAKDSLRELIIRQASGGDVDPGELLDAARLAGQSVDDVQAAIDRLEERLSAGEILAKCKDADTLAEIKKLKTAEAAEKENLAKVRADCKRRLEEAEQSFHLARGAVRIHEQRLSTARQGASRTLMVLADGSIDEEIRRLNGRIKALHQERNGKSYPVPSVAQLDAFDELSAIPQADWSNEQRELSAFVRRYRVDGNFRRTAVALERRLNQIPIELADCEREIAELRERQLDPVGGMGWV